VRADVLLPGEAQTVGGLPVTTLARTAFDLGRRLEVEKGVQRIDALMNATDVKVADVEAVIARHPGLRGLRQLRRTLDLVDGGAESPYESLTRLLLIKAGFPRPQTQIRVVDDNGFVSRIDMGWPEYLVGVDFEGAHHWTDPKQRNRDVERYAILRELGWIDVRLTSGITTTAQTCFSAAWVLHLSPAAAQRRGDCANSYAVSGELRMKPHGRR
jgi:hypothetical protein